MVLLHVQKQLMCAASLAVDGNIFFLFPPEIQDMCLEEITNLHLFVQDHQHFSRFGQSQKIIL